MWKPISEWPTLTELFFGKGVNPAGYTPSYLSGKSKKLNKSTANAMTDKKPAKKMKVVKAKATAPKNAKTDKKAIKTKTK